MTDTIDARQLAAQRLAWLGALQFQAQRRGLADAAPWRDPRQGQGRVLALLKMTPEITQRELTYLMGMSRQSLAELLAKLEKQGLIEREPSETDKRTVTVRLTEAGRATDQGTEPVGPGNLLDCLTDEEAAQLADYLGRIIERLEQHTGEDFDDRLASLKRYWTERGEDPREQRAMFERLRASRGGDPRTRGGFPNRGGFPGRDGFPDRGDFPGFPVMFGGRPSAGDEYSPYGEDSSQA